MLYGVSLTYKESASCRLEANYGMQNECGMIPLMMQVGSLFHFHIPSPRELCHLLSGSQRELVISRSSSHVWSDIIVVVYNYSQTTRPNGGWV